MRTLVLGGIRSGKSRWAEAAIAESLTADQPVHYLATGQVVDTDPAWWQRIAEHRDRRPPHWSTSETDDIAQQLRRSPDTPTLVDDIGGWLTATLDQRQAWEGGSVSADVDDLTGRGRGIRLAAGAGQPGGRADGGGRHRVGPPVRRRAGHTQSAVGPALRPGGAGGGRTSAADQAAQDLMMFAPVAPPDTAAAAAARARQDTLTKPRGALGRLEDLSVWVSSCQGHCPPRQFERARIVVFAGDHGVARSGVSAYPPEVTSQMVANIAAGGAAINALADIAGATVRVVDLAVDADPLSPQIGAHKVRRSSGDIADRGCAHRAGNPRRDRRRPPDRRPGGRCRRRPSDRR